ncbi:hypothetical protein JNUCC31_14375 [Paenibacillus sp. JNUCC31]|nr:hypothetical protein JNUCC31_14375 [Paenibacillus sp. JNUCC-31]
MIPLATASLRSLIMVPIGPWGKKFEKIDFGLFEKLVVSQPNAIITKEFIGKIGGNYTASKLDDQILYVAFHL